MERHPVESVKRDILEKESRKEDQTDGTGEASSYSLSVTDEHQERFKTQASFLSE